MRNNRRLKLISGALLLNRRDIARAVTNGGIKTSNNRADSWLRSGAAIETSHRYSQKQREAYDMSDDEFDAFCVGLKSVVDDLETESSDRTS